MTRTVYASSSDVALRNEVICQNCKHFCQHYIKIGPVHMPVLWGHCSEGRAKARKVYNTCKYFEKEEPQ